MSDSEHNEPIISMKKLMKLTAKQLKAKLQEKGLAYSAKNKELLAKRLYRFLNSFQSDSASDVDSDNSYEELHLPSADELQNWVTVETQHLPPSFSEQDILNYYSFHKHPTTGSRLNFTNTLTKSVCSALNFVPELGSSCKQSCTPSICMGLLLNCSLAELRERRLYILKYTNISVCVLFYHCTTMPQCSLYTFIACSVIVPGTLP